MTTTTPHPEGIGDAQDDIDFCRARTAVLVPLAGDDFGMGWRVDLPTTHDRLTEAAGSIDYGTGELADIARNWERPGPEALMHLLASRLGYHVFKCETF